MTVAWSDVSVSCLVYSRNINLGDDPEFTSWLAKQPVISSSLVFYGSELIAFNTAYACDMRGAKSCKVAMVSRAVSEERHHRHVGSGSGTKPR